MLEKIDKAIVRLSEEATSLTVYRENLHKKIAEINIRLDQIVGAIKELDELKQETSLPTESP